MTSNNRDTPRGDLIHSTLRASGAPAHIAAKIAATNTDSRGKNGRKALQI